MPEIAIAGKKFFFTLIPPYAAVGAAVASAVAYLVSDGMLILVLVRMNRAARHPDGTRTGRAVHGSKAQVSP